ncbi:hypothetical protein [Corallococcus sp. RDP092CA]|uniref:hypothetical protein n=1 Tax=Corallococcus sp. RDP092CA TaxID=3109369 RepID=UPI0035AE1F8E
MARATLSVDTNEQTYATATGALVHSPDTVTSMPYATAIGCNTTGPANADLGARRSPRPPSSSSRHWRSAGP